jgi:hypothetical protein
MAARVKKINTAAIILREYGNKEIPDNQATLAFMKYEAALRVQGDENALRFTLPYTQGRKPITGKNITGLLWQASMARDGFYVL